MANAPEVVGSVCGTRRDEIGETAIGGSVTEGGLLAQHREASEFLSSAAVGPEDDIVLLAVGRPEPVGGFGGDQALVNHLVQHLLAIFVEFTGRVTEFLIVENRGKAPSKFPGRKKECPVDIRNEIREIDRDRSISFRVKAGSGMSTSDQL